MIHLIKILKSISNPQLNYNFRVLGFFVLLLIIKIYNIRTKLSYIR